MLAAEGDIPRTAGAALVAAAYGAWFLLEVSLLARDWARGATATAADRGSRRVTYGGCVFAVGVATVTGLWLPTLDLPGGEVRRAAGALIALLGVALRLWAVVTLGGLFRVSVEVADRQPVVTSGPYRWARHPSYTGLLATVAGLGLGLGDAVGLLACVVVAPVALIYRIRIEEAALRSAMGAAYDAFARERRRLFPGVW